MENQGINIRRVFEIHDKRVLIEFIWLRIGPSGKPFWTQECAFCSLKRQGSFRLSDLYSEQRLVSIKFAG